MYQTSPRGGGRDLEMSLKWMLILGKPGDLIREIVQKVGYSRPEISKMCSTHIGYWGEPERALH